MSGTRSSSRLKALKAASNTSEHGSQSATTGMSSGARTRSNRRSAPTPPVTKPKTRLANKKGAAASDVAIAPARNASAPKAATANKRRKVATPIRAADDNNDSNGVRSVAAKKPRKRKGEQLQLADMPLDILFEIFKVCDPIDLLYLAQANKAFRATLLRKSCKWVWEHSVKAYRTVIPACPDNRLPLPQYINLLFGHCCFRCGSPKAKHALWSFFERLCTKCMQQNYFTLQRNDSYYGVQPEYKMPGNNGRLTRIANRKEFSRIKSELEPIKDVRARCKRELEINSASGKIMRFAATIEEFLLAETRKDYEHYRRVRVQRHNFIVGKLAEMGYKDELSRLKKWNAQYLEQFVDGDTVLTARAWTSLSVRVTDYIDALIPYRKKNTAIRTFRCRVSTLEKRLETYHDLCPRSLRPHWSELVVKEPLRTLLMQDLDLETTDVVSKVTDEELAVLGQQCAAEKLAFLRSLLPSKGEARRADKDRGEAEDEDENDRLYLATTYFKCFNCREPMPLSRVAMHHCLFKSDTKADEGDTEISLSTMLNSRATCDVPFYHPGSPADKVFFDEEAHLHAEVLIRACGLYPKRATFESMESLSVHVACDPCKGKKRLVMGWRQALLHSLQKHYAHEGGPIPAQWTVIDGANDKNAIRAMEVNAPLWGGVVKRCDVPGCHARIVCPVRYEEAWDWHMAMAHKDLSHASDWSMIFNYPCSVRL